MIRTSLNLSVEAHDILRRSANTHKKEIEALIIALMRFVAIHLRHSSVKKTAVKYQKSRGRHSWNCVRVRWKGHEYEFLTDLRKVHKISVSKLVNDAILKYLNYSLRFIKKILDKYSHHEHSISKSIKHNCIMYTFMWIFPQNIKLE